MELVGAVESTLEIVVRVKVMWRTEDVFELLSCITNGRKKKRSTGLIVHSYIFDRNQLLLMEKLINSLWRGGSVAVYKYLVENLSVLWYKLQYGMVAGKYLMRYGRLPTPKIHFRYIIFSVRQRHLFTHKMLYK